jgi:TetR/AcrR family transcriptional regulator, mexJK operon transcriptional repressor
MSRGSLPSMEKPLSRTDRKRQAILDAATEVFLQHGFLGTSMDEVAARAAVSKQTVYKQFASKEALFIGMVRSMTEQAGSRVQRDMRDPQDARQLAAELLAYAERQLAIVLTPSLMKLRRLVIGEAGRFPELGQALYEGGPGRAINGLSAAFARWAKRGLLVVDKPAVAAEHFNWLVMGAPINRAMFLGDKGIPKPAALRRHAAEAVRVFLAAYGSQPK